MEISELYQNLVFGLIYKKARKCKKRLRSSCHVKCEASVELKTMFDSIPLTVKQAESGICIRE